MLKILSVLIQTTLGKKQTNSSDNPILVNIFIKPSLGNSYIKILLEL